MRHAIGIYHTERAVYRGAKWQGSGSLAVTSYYGNSTRKWMKNLLGTAAPALQEMAAKN